MTELEMRVKEQENYILSDIEDIEGCLAALKSEVFLTSPSRDWIGRMLTATKKITEHQGIKEGLLRSTGYSTDEEGSME